MSPVFKWGNYLVWVSFSLSYLYLSYTLFLVNESQKRSIICICKFEVIMKQYTCHIKKSSLHVIPTYYTVKIILTLELSQFSLTFEDTSIFSGSSIPHKQFQWLSDYKPLSSRQHTMKNHCANFASEIEKFQSHLNTVGYSMPILHTSILSMHPSHAIAHQKTCRNEKNDKHKILPGETLYGCCSWEFKVYMNIE